jgi:phosphatidyl-myo-inositol dimannoside synthase
VRPLVLVTDAFGGNGGIAKFNRDLLSALCDYPSITEVVAIPRLIPNPIETLPLKLTYISSLRNSKFKYVIYVLKTILNKNRFDMIVCGHINLLPIAYLCKLIAKVPLVLVIYGVEAWKPTQKPLVNYLTKKIDAFIAISELTKKLFTGWAHIDGNKGFLLPCSIDISSFGPGPGNAELRNYYGLNGKTVIMTMGRIMAEERAKGFDEVMEVLSDLSRKIPNIAYLIAGDGTDRNRLESKAKKLGIEDRVVFTGFIPEDKKADYYRMADVFVMPSRWEGFGIVFLEALACGIPVIASSVDGSREAVRDGALGLLVDPDKPDEIKSAIFKALSLPKGSIPKGIDYFSFAHFQKRLHNIIERIMT